MKTTEQQTLEFITFCTEMYVWKKNVSGSEVVKLFCDFGVFDFLEENYIELHTQCREFLIRAEGFIPRRLRRCMLIQMIDEFLQARSK
ncbi:MAG: DUF3791 domain-containing protein [Treponema sp.]|nr:DUF3791 domain-containing protein [Treponema sp.]